MKNLSKVIDDVKSHNGGVPIKRVLSAIIAGLEEDQKEDEYKLYVEAIIAHLEEQRERLK